MNRFRLRLIYNLFIILIALLIGFFYFPSAQSQFAFLVSGIGFFLTLGFIIPKSKRNLRMGFMIAFFLTFSMVFAISYFK
ncbi:hypothetical protein ABE65_012410 [Fictibacillus phosphorivorans]|uniref:DUF3953 domain-containing protein n=1 Tax=Fictibacillus phosphorivorans TaxID=1221500 RepID=A0A160INH3_9BACL|nr:hypothetical protein ABE65_012410 [Fictibacillus phosphorivorans]